MKKGFCSRMGLDKAELYWENFFFPIRNLMIFNRYCDSQRQGSRIRHFPNRFDHGKLFSGFPLKLAKL